MAQCLNMLTHHVLRGSMRLMRPQVKPTPKEELLLSIIKSNAVAEAAAYPLTLMPSSFWVIEPRLQLHAWYPGDRLYFQPSLQWGRPCGQVWAARPECDCIVQVCPLQRKGTLSAPSFLVSLHSDWHVNAVNMERGNLSSQCG